MTAASALFSMGSTPPGGAGSGDGGGFGFASAQRGDHHAAFGLAAAGSPQAGSGVVVPGSVAHSTFASALAAPTAFEGLASQPSEIARLLAIGPSDRPNVAAGQSSSGLASLNPGGLIRGPGGALDLGSSGQFLAGHSMGTLPRMSPLGRAASDQAHGLDDHDHAP